MRTCGCVFGSAAARTRVRVLHLKRLRTHACAQTRTHVVARVVHDGQLAGLHPLLHEHAGVRAAVAQGRGNGRARADRGEGGRHARLVLAVLTVLPPPAAKLRGRVRRLRGRVHLPGSCGRAGRAVVVARTQRANGSVLLKQAWWWWCCCAGRLCWVCGRAGSRPHALTSRFESAQTKPTSALLPQRSRQRRRRRCRRRAAGRRALCSMAAGKKGELYKCARGPAAGPGGAWACHAVVIRLLRPAAAPRHAPQGERQEEGRAHLQH